jgi:hypothetical protein
MIYPTKTNKEALQMPNTNQAKHLICLYNDKYHRVTDIVKLEGEYCDEGNQFYAITFENGTTDYYTEGEFEDVTNEIFNG